MSSAGAGSEIRAAKRGLGRFQLGSALLEIGDHKCAWYVDCFCGGTVFGMANPDAVAGQSMLLAYGIATHQHVYRIGGCSSMYLGVRDHVRI